MIKLKEQWNLKGKKPTDMGKHENYSVAAKYSLETEKGWHGKTKFAAQVVFWL